MTEGEALKGYNYLFYLNSWHLKQFVTHSNTLHTYTSFKVCMFTLLPNPSQRTKVDTCN